MMFEMFISHIGSTYSPVASPLFESIGKKEVNDIEDL